MVQMKGEKFSCELSSLELTNQNEDQCVVILT